MIGIELIFSLRRKHLFPNLIDNERSLFRLRVHTDSAGCVKSQKSLSRERAQEGDWKTFERHFWHGVISALCIWDFLRLNMIDAEVVTFVMHKLKSSNSTKHPFFSLLFQTAKNFLSYFYILFHSLSFILQVVPLLQSSVLGIKY